MFNIISLDTLAREAYQAYCNIADFHGDIIPTFDELPDDVQDAWKEAARRVTELVTP